SQSSLHRPPARADSRSCGHIPLTPAALHALMNRMTPDATSAFNAELASAKLAALRIIQDLIRALDYPDPPIPARYRELRLLAVTILRTQPIKPAKNTPAPPPAHAPDPAPSPNPPSDHPDTAEPARTSTPI